MSKPFVFGMSTEGENFTDREEDTKRLAMNFKAGINTVLISPRRWGKTSLVRRTVEQCRMQGQHIVFMDIFSCKDENDFYRMFSANVLKQTASRMEEIVSNARDFLSGIVPHISFGSDPASTMDISFSFSANEKDMEEILNLPQRIAQRKGIDIVVCIDEFQQLLDIDDGITFQKKLRTAWQHQDRVSYCLFGSKKHLMSMLFEKKNLPFYKFGDVLYLKKIDTGHWVDYICERFEAFGKHIGREFAAEICQSVDNHSSYVQQLAWLTFVHSDKDVDEEDVEQAKADLLEQNSPLYMREVELLKSYQMNFVRALCDGVTEGFSRKETSERYNLGSSGTIYKVKKALEEKEIIDISNGEITLLDPVFKMWFKRKMK